MCRQHSTRKNNLYISDISYFWLLNNGNYALWIVWSASLPCCQVALRKHVGIMLLENVIVGNRAITKVEAIYNMLYKILSLNT
jgi:hypothetical protein